MIKNNYAFLIRDNDNKTRKHELRVYYRIKSRVKSDHANVGQ